ADGHYDLRVTATDRAGNVATSSLVADRTIDNTKPTIDLADMGANVHGTVNLSSTASDGGSGIASTTYHYSPTGQNDWHTTPAAWNTTAIADGLYDVRATAADRAGNSRTSTVAGIRVDNTAPTVSLDSPGTYVHGTVQLSATATDSGSGVGSLNYQYSPHDAQTWTNTPAAWDTSGLADGTYDLR